MSLLTIAELLAGEAMVTPGGPVDRITAVGDDQPLWAHGATAAEVTLQHQAHNVEQARARTAVPAGV
jgi:hypothetical protein